jgi:RNA-directed DNA polymerase
LSLPPGFWSPGAADPDALQDNAFDEAFSVRALEQVHDQTIESGTAPGRDRIDAESFGQQRAEQLRIVSSKCLAGSYRFSAYRSKLIPKGPYAPREVSIPTIRDRIVLTQIHNLLKRGFADCVRRGLPNTIVSRVYEAVKGAPAAAGAWRVDISNFFGTVAHDALVSVLQRRKTTERLLDLVSQAIKTPTLGKAQASATAQRNIQGVPQGLPISNLLAEIALKDFDDIVNSAPFFYERYVDDILILGLPSAVRNQDPWALLARHGFGLNRQKTTPQDSPRALSDGFDFLGYHISNTGIAPKAQSVQTLCSTLAGQFAAFRKDRFRGPARTSDSDRRKAFIEDLNFRITGAVSEKQRYGWLAFYSAITRLESLYQLDAVVASLIRRSQDYAGGKPAELKTFARAFFEMKHRPERGYVFNYDNMTLQAQMEYLRLRGYIQPATPTAQYSAKQIERLFDRVRKQKLTRLDRDVGLLS